MTILLQLPMVHAFCLCLPLCYAMLKLDLKIFIVQYLILLLSQFKPRRLTIADFNRACIFCYDCLLALHYFMIVCMYLYDV